MNVSHFIGFSSAVLLTWLGFTFFHQMPREPHSKPDRFSPETVESPVLENTPTASVNK
jgi:hypothetical protein